MTYRIRNHSRCDVNTTTCDDHIKYEDYKTWPLRVRLEQADTNDTSLSEAGRYSSETSIQPFHPGRDAVWRDEGQLTVCLRVMRGGRTAPEEDALRLDPDRVREALEGTMETLLTTEEI
jgi:hypothetical protein